MKTNFKIIFLGLVVLIFFGACKSSASSEKEIVKYLPPLTDLQKYNLKGKVKKLTQGRSITEFNESGFDIKQTKITLTREYGFTKIYNSDNIITGVIISGSKKVSYAVNSRNLMEKETAGNVTRKIITYNKDFTEGRQEMKNREGVRVSEQILKLDAKLRIRETILKGYSDDGTALKSTMISKYNNNGQMTSSIRRDEKGEIINQTTREYNDNHQITKDVYGTGIIMYTYGADTFVSEKNHKSGSDEPTITKYTYEVDDKGNWTKRIETEEGSTDRPTGTTRTYEYY